jgi:general secretion pathway protein N
MSRRSLLVAAGIVAFLVCLVAMVPANQLAMRLPPGVVMSGVGGTIWSGRANGLAIDGRSIGRIQWSCRPWRILLLEWSCHVGLSPAGGELSADLQGEINSDEISGRDILGQVPITAFEGLVTPRGWSGLLELHVKTLRIIDRRPADATGSLFLRSLRAPGADGEMLGDFELTVGEGSVGTGSLSGRLRDLGGPLHVRGTIELQPDGRYLLSGEAAPGPGAGPAIFDTLSFLGPPDNQGRRPFTIEGSF